MNSAGVAITVLAENTALGMGLIAEHGLSLWIETPAGIVVLLGCAHSGVINTLDHIRGLAGRKPFRAIAGGMHLVSASDDRLVRTIDSLKQMNVEGLWPCHCTGATATARLMAAFGDRCRPCGVGTKLEF